eukprot:gene25265-biopygen23971
MAAGRASWLGVAPAPPARRPSVAPCGRHPCSAIPSAPRAPGRSAACACVCGRAAAAAAVLLFSALRQPVPPKIRRGRQQPSLSGLHRRHAAWERMHAKRLSRWSGARQRPGGRAACGSTYHLPPSGGCAVLTAPAGTAMTAGRPSAYCLRACTVTLVADLCAGHGARRPLTGGRTPCLPIQGAESPAGEWRVPIGLCNPAARPRRLVGRRCRHAGGQTHARAVMRSTEDTDGDGRPAKVSHNCEDLSYHAGEPVYYANSARTAVPCAPRVVRALHCPGARFHRRRHAAFALPSAWSSLPAMPATEPGAVPDINGAPGATVRRRLVLAEPIPPLSRLCGLRGCLKSAIWRPDAHRRPPLAELLWPGAARRPTVAPCGRHPCGASPSAPRSAGGCPPGGTAQPCRRRPCASAPWRRAAWMLLLYPRCRARADDGSDLVSQAGTRGRARGPHARGRLHAGAA